ncbi:PaaX family transcriptional regulator C-terminal domain-containing protein [Luteipulveratus mongoliensis]|uniref:PaaX domain-containing protein, C-domain protein n=1 Tax=Luteipulveratus mongoliensis TaxID=571913 RepID=A0A0K1JPL5_9MICO|nr:PaaX family transcriptional regulator C-terminal domain-containing protein [Luteipulveratus mongoliensis]AKU18662.1 PaaX domain-containing protein, C- domain protein [Luteipulveratus mongoliensis]
MPYADRTSPSTEPPPLSARSVALSLLLGSHPDRMTARQLTRAAEHVGIAAATLRVALTRAVAAGDLRRDGPDYVLGERLVARQRRQDAAVEDAETPWAGDWEMAVIVIAGRSGPERAALRDRLTDARLTELREGVWTRPANLSRPTSYADDPVLTTFRATPDDAADLVGRLWDLPGWATDGRALLARLARTHEPAERLAVAAQLVRHLTTDPLLPAALLPTDWPGAELRAAYAGYQGDLRAAANAAPRS